MNAKYNTELKTVLLEQGRKATWVAGRIGVRASTVSRWANGEWEITDAHAVELAELLEVPIERIKPKEPVNA